MRRCERNRIHRRALFGAGSVDVADAARAVIGQVGYRAGEFNAEDCTILTSLSEISSLPRLPEDAPSDLQDDLVDTFVAQHQATIFGYACKQTPAFMPLPIQLAHRLALALDGERNGDRLSYLLPDAKTQVAVEYETVPRAAFTASR